MNPQPSVGQGLADTTRLRKACKKTVEIVPKARQLFRGLVFYFVSPDSVGASKRCIVEATAHGAVWTEEWSQNLTHMIVDDHFNYEQALAALEDHKVPSHVAIVNSRWIIDCLGANKLQDPAESRFRILSSSTGIERTALSGEIQSSTNVLNRTADVTSSLRGGAIYTDTEYAEYNDFLSDDSSFCGGDELEAEYEARAAAFDPSHYWESQARDTLSAAETARVKAASQKAKTDVERLEMKRDTSSDKKECVEKGIDTQVIYDSVSQASTCTWVGDPTAKQPHETLSAFLSRLRPSAARRATDPCARITVPLPPDRVFEKDLASFKGQGFTLLDEYMDRRERLEDAYRDRSPGFVPRRLDDDRIRLEKDIIALAKSTNVVGGKWMLFSVEPVDAFWKVAATQTLNGTLGCAAEVFATHKGSGSGYMIWIYTYNFEDVGDVRRVLRRMKELGLVKNGLTIYYKCEAYSHLELKSRNRWGLKVGMYNNSGLLRER